MSEPNQKPAEGEIRNGFFVNNGTFSGNFTTPDGDVYDIRKLEPREVTDPRDGTVSTIWGGYATARDRDLAARDAMLQADFKKTGERPAELFQPESKDIPLYVTLRNRPGKGFTDIGSFWNSRGRYTVLARDLAGKSGLRFGGNLTNLGCVELASQSPDIAFNERPPQRRTQIAGTRAIELKDLDGDNARWVLPPRSKRLDRAGRTKNQGAQIVYLSKQAAALYSEAMKLCRAGDYVFPADTDRTKDGKTRKPHIHGESVTKAVARAREDDVMQQAKKAAAAELGAADIEDITIHDMRRAISTYLGNEGVQEIVIKMILHHAPDDVTGKHYDKAKRERQLRDAWQMWADHVDRIVNAADPNSTSAADGRDAGPQNNLTAETAPAK